VGMKIGQRAIDVHLKPFEPVQRMMAARSLDIPGLIKEHAGLLDLAKQVETSKDPSLAQTLIERERAFLERVRDTREKLLELAKQHPEKFPGGSVKAPDAQ